MQNKNIKKILPVIFIIFSVIIINAPFLVIPFIIITLSLLLKNKNIKNNITNYLQKLQKNNISSNNPNLIENTYNNKEDEIDSYPSDTKEIFTTDNEIIIQEEIFAQKPIQTKLSKRTKYLHIALNNTIEEARDIISQLPSSNRILIEVGTPLIKIYGINSISQIKNIAPNGTYIIADNKCADLAEKEVEMMASVGANAATCLGVAPIETIDIFINECKKHNIDSIIDMMNVSDALNVLKRLKKLPNVVMLHRGVDETEFSKEKQIPYYQIKQIKGNYDVLIAVAGGDTIQEVQKSLFNDADIVVVWKNFYQANKETAQLARSFLKEIQ